ncbi:MAG: adenosylcobinamide-phosphate synthase CbiB [Lachnospiraceae bacterium]|nr:adenosylcobinamide-phosphate synthase CbiB [Lachnospiraceae bacterium]
MVYHIISFLMGILLDFILGDPECAPHPIRLIGGMIARLDGLLYQKEHSHKRLICSGALLVGMVLCSTILVTGGMIWLSYSFSPILGILVETILTYYILAAKSLSVESKKVYEALEQRGLAAGRYAVSRIVGRDTESLTEEGVIRAAVETVAENTSDGVIAPLLYTFFGGPILGMAYKAINTMDSMLGYHNQKYEYFGKVAARLDDVANYLPARLSALFMILATLVLGRKFSTKGAITIYGRDRNNHKSPNSAHTESVLAGALGVELAGDAYYFGKKVSKPTIGDALRPIKREDILLAADCMFMTEGVALVLLLGIAAGWMKYFS